MTINTMNRNLETNRPPPIESRNRTSTTGEGRAPVARSFHDLFENEGGERQFRLLSSGLTRGVVAPFHLRLSLRATRYALTDCAAPAPDRTRNRKNVRRRWIGRARRGLFRTPGCGGLVAFDQEPTRLVFNHGVEVGDRHPDDREATGVSAFAEKGGRLGVTELLRQPPEIAVRAPHQARRAYDLRLRGRAGSVRIRRTCCHLVPPGESRSCASLSFGRRISTQRF
jgi:hypothetical protein